MNTINEKLDDIPEKTNNKMEKFAIVTGLLLSVCYIVFFLVMETLGLAAVPEYRIVNFLIQFIGIAISIRYYKSANRGNFNYLEGLGLGCLASFISVVVFAVFIYIYLQQINPQLLPDLMSRSEMMGKYLTPFTSALTVVIEGCIAGLIISFSFMQFFKEDSLHNPLKKKSSEIE